MLSEEQWEHYGVVRVCVKTMLTTFELKKFSLSLLGTHFCPLFTQNGNTVILFIWQQVLLLFFLSFYRIFQRCNTFWQPTPTPQAQHMYSKYPEENYPCQRLFLGSSRLESYLDILSRRRQEHWVSARFVGGQFTAYSLASQARIFSWATTESYTHDPKLSWRPSRAFDLSMHARKGGFIASPPREDLLVPEFL